MLNYQSITSPHNEPQTSPEFVQKQPLEVFCKKGVLKTFTNFTGKHLRWSLFLITLLVFRPETLRKRYRSNHQRCSIKRAVLKNFAIFTGKHLCRSRFFVKVVGLPVCNFIKKRLQLLYFSFINIRTYQYLFS